MNNRRLEALRIRQDAAQQASDRPHPPHVSNGEELRYRDDHNAPTYLGSYTKGLPHDYDGVVDDPDAFQQFVRGIDSGDERDLQAAPLGPLNAQGEADPQHPQWKSEIACQANAAVRAWESAGAGNTYDLQGPDAQAVTMPPAPLLDSPELVSEMVEVYSMALLRDVPFSAFRGHAASHFEIDDAISRMNQTDWIRGPIEERPGFRPGDLTTAERSRLRQPVSRQTVFRGVTPGDEVGPYLSQFMLIGNTGLQNAQDLEDGFIQYGSIRIDQRVRVATCGRDYMTTWESWLDVQNGADLRGIETYDRDPSYRFITTPRDLATYVHYDALYQAYLNACLILLGLGMPFDPGIPFQREDFRDRQQGFAQFGGPHILSLVTEVATRALKAVRFQKFNVHRRARPETVGGWLSRYCNHDRDGLEIIAALAGGFDDEFLSQIAAHNASQNQQSDRAGDRNRGWPDSFLLPMAFPEGSPMHPAYGAGHATVAGACVTILKAFFDHGALLVEPTTKLPICFEPDANGQSLRRVGLDQPLTVEGELNKLTSNISIGRNWAGVHYFTDYIESIRLGERIAIGILEEQKLTYGENFSMTVPLFDGGTVRI